MSPIGLAVIGAGYWGPNLVRTARATPEFRLRWLCDLDLERARRSLGPYTSVRATASYEQVLADPEVAAVAIATPAATHFDLVRAALEAGKHVLVEKPLTATVAEGEKLAGLARRRADADVRSHLLLHAGSAPDPRAGPARARSATSSTSTRSAINLGLVQPDVDVLWDLAPHDLSILDFVLPGRASRRSRWPPTALIRSAPGTACLAYLTVWLSTGRSPTCTSTGSARPRSGRLVIGGSRRTIVWDDLNPAQRLIDPRPRRGPAAAAVLAPDERRQALISYRTGDIGRARACPSRRHCAS